MNLNIDLNLVIQAVVAFAIIWGIKALSSVLNRINKNLTVMNGRVVSIESWQESHDKQDDERHKDLTTRLDKVAQ